MKTHLRINGLELFYVHDMDPKDTSDDIIACTRKKMFLFRNHGRSFNRERSIRFRRKGLPIGIFNIREDDEPKCFVFVPVEGGYEIDCYAWDDPDDPETPLYTLKLLAPGVAPFGLLAEDGIEIIACFDADDDLSNEIYLRVSADSAGQRRHRILSYEGATGKLRWRFDSPGCPTRCILMPAIAGRSRIIVCTSDPKETPSCAGTADSLARIYALRPDGFKEHEFLVSPLRAHATIALSHSYETALPEILVGKYFDSELSPLVKSNEVWSFAKLSSQLDRLMSGRTPPARPIQMLSCDIKEDGDPEIVVVNEHGSLSVLESDFTLFRKSDNDDILHKKILAVGNFNEDTSLEIVCLAFDSLVVIRNVKAELLAARSFRLPLDVSSVCMGTLSSRRLLAVRNGDAIDLCAMVSTGSLARNPSWSKKPLIAIAIVATVLFAVRYGIGPRKGVGVSSEKVAHENLLATMEAFQHGGSSLKTLHRIGLFLKNWNETLGSTSSSRETMAELLEMLANTVGPELARIAIIARQAGLPAVAWKGIPPATAQLQAALESLVGAGDPVQSIIDDAQESLASILDSRRQILLNLREYFSAPLEQTIRAAIARKREGSDARPVRVEFAGEGIESAFAFVSPVILEKVIDDLILNSIAATAGTEAPSVSISAKIDGSRCKIDVADNGGGIEKNDWERIFDRDYTTKEKGGFGLYYARTELAKFDGEISVLESRLSSGTTVRIVLNVVAEDSKSA